MIDRKPIIGLTIEQQPVRILEPILLVGEARGEQDQGGALESVAMAAVHFIPYNRQKRPRWKDLSIREIILERYAFSCFNANDPNRAKLLDMWQTEGLAWERADTICDLHEAGFLIDPSKGATHYVTARLWGRTTPDGQRPQWFELPEIQAGRTKKLVEIGNHVFAEAP